ncbi:MAG: CHASE3 domain-containing protein [Flavobacteriales bacterium]|nr:CHASE3 domain-containing protein [Flavobacteriales bacterium]
MRLLRLLYASALVLLLIVFLAALRGFTRNKEITEDRRLMLLELAEVHGLLSALKDVETGCRGFVITHDTSYLRSYNQALIEIPEELGGVVHYAPFTAE